MSSLRRHCRRLRTALLVLLVLGMVVSPTLAAVGELHGADHALAATGDDAHGHTHPADDVHHDHGDGGDGSDPGHATGGHGLMHQGASLSVTMPDEPPAVSGVALGEPLLPEFRRLQLPGDSPNLPFRPPIA
jgi:hypothetical protein